uniref:Uncharacterized protein n=1 Tax=Zea mays TaxID=4577 RepID=A0A804PUB0_MAIZE
MEVLSSDLEQQGCKLPFRTTLNFWRKGNTGPVNLVENSCLDLFFKSTATMDDPHERVVCLEKDDTMARAHLLAANDGATEGMSPDVAIAPKSKGCLMIGEYNKVAKK